MITFPRGGFLTFFTFISINSIAIRKPRKKNQININHAIKWKRKTCINVVRNAKAWTMPVLSHHCMPTTKYAGRWKDRPTRSERKRNRKLDKRTFECNEMIYSYICMSVVNGRDRMVAATCAHCITISSRCYFFDMDECIRIKRKYI